jgi:hypothetical protein
LNGYIVGLSDYSSCRQDCWTAISGRKVSENGQTMLKPNMSACNRRCSTFCRILQRRLWFCPWTVESPLAPQAVTSCYVLCVCACGQMQVDFPSHQCIWQWWCGAYYRVLQIALHSSCCKNGIDGVATMTRRVLFLLNPKRGAWFAQNL